MVLSGRGQSSRLKDIGPKDHLVRSYRRDGPATRRAHATRDSYGFSFPESRRQNQQDPTSRSGRGLKRQPRTTPREGGGGSWQPPPENRSGPGQRSGSRSTHRVEV